MGQTVYIKSDDYSDFGVDSACSPAVEQATEIINGYLRRPEGLIWQADATGQPAFMLGADPILSLTAQSSFGPGSNITIAVDGGVSSALIGEAIMIDRASASISELCVVAGIDVSIQSVTLAKVQFHHTVGASLENGLTIAETCALPVGRSVARVSRMPVVRLVAGAGRYAYGRRGEMFPGHMMDVGLLGALSAMGGVPGWTIFDAAQVDVSNDLGELWIPSGMMLANYSEVKLRYIAGWTYATLPNAIKQATANIVRALSDMPVTAAAQMVSTANIKIQRYRNSVLDADTQQLLSPYRARGLL